MNNILILNFLTGLILLFILVIFHWITFFIFTPGINFFNDFFNSREREVVFYEISRNPSFVIGYIIPLLMEFLFACALIFLRHILGFITRINDVILICLTPGLIIYLYSIFIYLIDSRLNQNFQNIYQTPIAENLILVVANTIIITFGGLTGLLLTIMFK